MNRTRIVIIISLLFVCASCTDNQKVMKEYKKGNPYAIYMLKNGFNSRVSEYIPTVIIDKALLGDKDALEIVVAQSQALARIPNESNRTVIIPNPHPALTPRSRS